MAQITNSERDSITKIIGDNLLKGYRLMDEVCHQCSTPMMCPRGGEPFCVFCELKQKAEAREHKNEQVTLQQKPINEINNINPSHAINQKLAWAVDRLNNTTDLDQSLKLAQLIQTLVETLLRLKESI